MDFKWSWLSISKKYSILKGVNFLTKTLSLKCMSTSIYNCVLKCPPISVWNQHTEMCLHLNTEWGHLKYLPFTQFKQIYIFLKICTAIDIWTSTNKHQMYYNQLIKKLFEKEKILCEINYLNVNSALSQLLFSSHSILHHIVRWPFIRITFNPRLSFFQSQYQA